MNYEKHDILYCPTCMKTERFVVHPAYAQCGGCGKKLVKHARIIDASFVKRPGISPAM